MEHQLNQGDDEDMISSSNSKQSYNFQASNVDRKRKKCLIHHPEAVGRNLAHFDLILARQEYEKGSDTGDWLVLHLQELISLAY
ncbi:protein SWEETIE [Arachis hypogaea]|uniref:protein SWEETIE n=1 Tax=Arachis hypogaea TaxID=3818 RepID=UPI000DECA7B0|nr:protein SWEETIE [Arachis hypogaea]